MPTRNKRPKTTTVTDGVAAVQATMADEMAKGVEQVRSVVTNAVAHLQPAVFNPNSFDAQFATLNTLFTANALSQNLRMDSQDRKLDLIKEQTTATNGRVSIIEGNWKRAVGWLAGAMFVLTAVGWYLVHVWRL